MEFPMRSSLWLLIALSFRPQFAIECLRRCFQQRAGSLWVKFYGVPFGVAYIHDVGVWRESKHPGVTNRTITFEDF